MYAGIWQAGRNRPLCHFRCRLWQPAICLRTWRVVKHTHFPAYSGIGLRSYLLAEFDVNKRITFWIRYSHTRYTDRDTIGSGADMISVKEKLPAHSGTDKNPKLSENHMHATKLVTPSSPPDVHWRNCTIVITEAHLFVKKRWQRALRGYKAKFCRLNGSESILQKH